MTCLKWVAIGLSWVSQGVVIYFRRTPPCNSVIIGIQENPNIIFTIPYSHYYWVGGPPKIYYLPPSALDPKPFSESGQALKIAASAKELEIVDVEPVPEYRMLEQYDLGSVSGFRIHGSGFREGLRLRVWGLGRI